MASDQVRAVGVGRGRGKSIQPNFDAPLRRPTADSQGSYDSLDKEEFGPVKIDTIEKITQGIKSSATLRSFTDILVERAVSSRNFGENLLMKVKELTSFTVEDKKFRTVFLSSIQSKFKEMEVILKINQNHYANFIFFMKECIKHLRMPNDDPITALVNAFLELIPAALKPGITLEMAIVIRESMFSLFDDLWKFASPKCEEVLEDARELVIKNSFDMKIGNELLFLAEIVHYRCSGDIPSFLLTYYKEKGLKF